MGKKDGKLNPDMVDVNEYDPTLYNEVTFAPHDNETRFYLEENVLPALIPGLQKLLHIVHEQPDSASAQVNPLNWLGSFLMRNNPKHTDTLDEHPYVVKLRKHLETCRPAIEAKIAKRKEQERLAREKREKEAAEIAAANAALAERQRIAREKLQREQAEAAARKKERLEAEARAKEEAARREREAEEARQAELERIRKMQEDAQKIELMRKEAEEKRLAELHEIQVQAQKISDKRSAFLTRQQVYSFSVNNEVDFLSFQQNIVDEMASLLPSNPVVYITQRQSDTRFKSIRDTSAANEEKDLLVNVISKNAPVVMKQQQTVPFDSTAKKAFESKIMFVDDEGSVHTDSEVSSRVAQGGDVDNEELSTASNAGVDNNGGHATRPSTPLLNKKTFTKTLFNSNQTPSGFVTVDYSGSDHVVNSNDLKFIDNCCALVEKARQNRDLNDSIKRVNKRASELFNENKSDVYDAGMQELLQFIPNSTQAFTAELNDDTLVCIAEKKKPNLRVDTSRKSKVSHIGDRLVSSPTETFNAVTSGKPVYLDNIDDMSDDELFGGDGRTNRGAVIIPLEDENDQVIGIISVEIDHNLGENGKTVISAEQMDQLKQFSKVMGKSISKVDAREKLSILGQQAVDWITLSTDVKNAYFGLIRDDGDLQYVAASESSQEMVGKVLPRGKGPTWKAIDSKESVRIDNIRKTNHNLFFFNDQEADLGGSFLTTPVCDRNNNVIGVLTVNKLGKISNESTQLTDDEVNTIEISSKTIAEAAADIVVQDDDDESTIDDDSSEAGSIRGALAIESDIKTLDKKIIIDKADKSKTKFLKRMLVRCRKNVRSLDASAVSEIAMYKKPPKVVHRVLKAVFYLIGFKRADLKTWNQCRNLIKKRENLTKIYRFDPTKKSKKHPWKQARILVKSLSYERMAKASRPALLLYSFTQIAFGLHDQAVLLRKKMAIKQNQDVSTVEEEDDEEEPTEVDVKDDIDDADDVGVIDEAHNESQVLV